MPAVLPTLCSSFALTGRAAFSASATAPTQPGYTRRYYPPLRPPMRPLSDFLRLPLRAARVCVHWVLALVILFEEWGWEPLQRALARIGQLPGLRWLELRISRLPPYAALAVFLVPSMLLLPVKLLALWLIGRGLVLIGALVILLAKLVGTAVLARLFKLTQPALMSLPWFARVYRRWAVWKAQLLARVRASWAWTRARQLRDHWRAQWQVWRDR